MSEHLLQIATADYLRHALPPSALFFHVPNGELRTKRTASKLKAYGVMPGVPDIIVIYQNKMVGIELKAPKGRVSPEQKHVGAMFIAHGFAWGVARSLDDVEALLGNIPLRATLARAA